MKFLVNTASGLFLLIASVTSNSAVADIDHSFDLGFGLRYGGLLGGKYNITYQQHRASFSLGYVGITAAYEKALDPSWSIAATLGVSFANYAVASLIYNHNGSLNSGWHVSADIGAGKSSFWCYDRCKTQAIGFFSFGYTF